MSAVHVSADHRCVSVKAYHVHVTREVMVEGYPAIFAATKTAVKAKPGCLLPPRFNLSVVLQKLTMLTFILAT